MKQKLKIIVYVMLALAAFNLTAYVAEAQDPPPPADFSHEAQILLTPSAEEYRSIMLTPTIFSLCRPGLPDLRLLDQNGEEIPYFFNSAWHENIEDLSQRYPLSFVEEYQKSDDVYVIYEVPQASADRDVILSSLKLDIRGENYAKQVTVSASYDGQAWENVSSAVVYSVDENSAAAIDLGGERRYKFYRLQIPNNREQVNITGVTGIHAASSLTSLRQTLQLEAVCTLEESNDRTLIHITNARGLPLTSVELITDSIFKRKVRLSGAGAAEILYNLEFAGVPLKFTTLLLGGQALYADDIVLTIENMDDKPLNIQGIMLEYQAVQLIFPARGVTEATLWFGSDEAQRPRYDIESYQTQILEQSIGACGLSAPKMLEQSPPGRDFSTLFTISVVAVVIIAGIIIVIQLRKKQ